MHPIERLRYVARASGADPVLLVQETAGALASLGFDPPGIVTACRRILERHPTSGALWWLGGRVLTSGDPVREAWVCADEIEGDTTGAELSWALPEDGIVTTLGWPATVGEALTRRGDVEVLVVDALGEGSGLVRRLRRADVDAQEVPVHGLGAAAAAADVVVLEASAIGPEGFVGVAGSRAAAAVASTSGVPVWVVGGIGRLLPASVWRVLTARLAEGSDPWDAEDEVVPIDLVTHIAGPSGVVPVAEALTRIDCPVAPELFKSTAF